MMSKGVEIVGIVFVLVHNIFMGESLELQKKLGDIKDRGRF